MKLKAIEISMEDKEGLIHSVIVARKSLNKGLLMELEEVFESRRQLK